ncbi:unnamed protein product [Candida verbasci]|uniref:tRNA:m(4)X modification enzyme TRM13 n=1 Tax=Candida verbasci TaxID=1227364 RepID=A0A9W4TSV4_9ASCO|nr:unnamed protein product [Candida verbasci]
MEEPKNKKQKIIGEARKTKGGISYRCEHIIPEKNRRCNMQRKATNKFCSEHQILETEKRIPCPLDPKHTIWEKDLKSHMKKCNWKPKEEHDPWFELDKNCTLQNSEDFNLENEETDEEVELLIKYIPILQGIKFEPLPIKQLQHDGMSTKFDVKLMQKHITQQSSLIENLKSLDLLNANTFYMEFGCGRAELSKFVQQCIVYDQPKDSKGYGYGLIDRGVNRYKCDNHLLKETDLEPIVKRSRMDIKDLNLDKFIDDKSVNHVVTISKHLCGAATDLTLKSIFNSNETNSKFDGMIVAMCCRHLCQLDQLLPQSRKYLHDQGFKTIQSFNVLKKMVSWAVDSSRKENDEHISGLNKDERKDLGLKARRLIDESRVFAIQQILSNSYQVDLFHYVDTSITLENNCLSIKRLS